MATLSDRFNPIWNEEFLFKLKNPELSFVQFTLANKNSFVGHYSIMFPVMKKGDNLYNLYFIYLNNFVFRLSVHFTIRTKL